MNIQNEIKPGKARSRSLIVIDDEEPILASLQSLFRREGYKMEFFSSCNKALEFLKMNNADVIITDMRMPEMSGTELLEHSINICPNAIRIIISGYEEKSIILNAISHGLARYYVMKPWDDDQLRSIVSESMNFQQKLRQKKLQQILLSFCNLPSPPRLHSRLKEILQKDPLSQKEIASEVEKSPALVAKLLRISNSIFYGTHKSISSIFDALTFIGTESTLNIVLCLESFDNLCSKASPKVVEKVEEIRMNSIKRAQLARQIAQRWNQKADPEEAYIAGLMLDIGLVFRFCSSSEKFDIFCDIHSKNQQPVFRIDKELYSITHDEVGEALLDYWNFSPQIVYAVANHHNYASNDPLTTIVQIADFLINKNYAVPHDPRIEELAKDWEVEFIDIINSIRTMEIL